MTLKTDKPTILYVEDEDGIQQALSKFLKRFSSELFLANDGEIGFELYKQHNPDIVISDIKMPNVDGIEMVKNIKEINSEQYVIFTTAFSDNEYLFEAIDLQVDAYILKPMNLKQLERKIKQISDNINLQKELDLKERMLIEQSKLAAMGEMIGNIAHQWRQPLAVITATASGIEFENEFDTLTPNKIDESMKQIVKSAKYLSQTIDDFRDFFMKKNSGGLTSSLKEFLEKSIDLTTASFQNNYIEVIQDIKDDVNVYGDTNQLSQAIINILNNARDALKEIEQDSKCIFIVTAQKEDKSIKISIKDNAGGIEEHILDRVFEPYFTTKHKSRGTGLGLYITYQIIVHNLNGKIEVKNEQFEYKGETYTGANFIITLPIIDED
jgi:signal transduction histidine kinase